MTPPPPSPREPAAVVVTVAALLGILTLSGAIVVSRNVVTVWMDPEFTGWVAPIARRLHDGVRLYEHGTHQPMPPLPALLLHAVGGTSATWRDERTVVHVTQSLVALGMFGVLARARGVGTAAVASLVTVAYLVAGLKTLAYDPLVQLGVVGTLAAVVGYTSARARGTHGVGWLVGLATATTWMLLTKHSTALGAAAGVCGVMLVSRAPVTRRLGHVVAYGALTALLLGLSLVALSGRVSPAGYLDDVLLHGSEPKGGAVALLSRLATFPLQAGLVLLALVPLGGVFAALTGARPARDDAPTATTSDTSLAAFAALGLLVGAVALPLFGGATVWFSRVGPLNEPLGDLAHTTVTVALWTGLALALRELVADLRAGEVSPTGALTLVAVGAALLHSLSAFNFRWAYDGNPLVPVALAALWTRAPAVIGAWVPGDDARRALGLRLSAGLLALCGAAFLVHPQRIGGLDAGGGPILALGTSTEVWDEIPYLAGATMRSDGEALRTLVRDVRAASSLPGDTVLMLPEDPNVLAMIDRPRPPLSSTIVFVDQYRDVYVDADLAALKAAPPAVVLVGPEDYWRIFSHRWHTGWGAERLIDGVLRDVVPHGYTKLAPVEVAFRDGTKTFDVWVRRPVSATTP